MSVQKGVSIETQTVAVDYAYVRRQDRAESLHRFAIETLHLRERRDGSIHRFQLFGFVGPGVNEYRNRASERNVGKSFRRRIEKTPASLGQHSHHRIAKRVVQHGRAAARRVEAELVLGLKHEHSGMVCKSGGCGKTCDAAADDKNVGARRQEPDSLSLTIFPSAVRRIACTISSSSGRTGALLSSSQNEERKL